MKASRKVYKMYTNFFVRMDLKKNFLYTHTNTHINNLYKYN